MSLDLQKILESKRALRRDLAMQPVAERLRMLDDIHPESVQGRFSRITDCAPGKMPD
jgi:hypothetical protein